MKIRLFTVPNLLTLANLLCGAAAVIYVLAPDEPNLRMAFLLVVAAAVFDFLDGFAARLLKQYSEIGKQLDSLADMVSFGVAPAVALYALYYATGGEAWWRAGGWLMLSVACFAALRLARFNIDESQTSEFRGLATPAAALFVMPFAYVYMANGLDWHPLWLLVIAAAVCWLMVSPIRMFSFKFSTFGFRANALRYCFLIASAAALVIFREAAMPMIITAYVVVSALRHAFCVKS